MVRRTRTKKIHTGKATRHEEASASPILSPRKRMANRTGFTRPQCVTRLSTHPVDGFMNLTGIHPNHSIPFDGETPVSPDTDCDDK
jgi:hypothetical protein